MVLSKWSTIGDVIGNIPVRGYVGLMIFISCVMSYMLRTNLSINILAMVESSPNNPSPENITANPHVDSILFGAQNVTVAPTILLMITPPPDYGVRYAWSEQQVSILLGAYFWGYLFSTLIGGFLADKFGASTVIMFTMCLTCATTVFCPIGAQAHFIYIYILRFLTGAFAGPLYPALQNLISKWAPPTEKGKFMSAMMGGNFGTVVTWPLIGLIIESIGWVYGFYVPALLSALAAFFWWYNVTDTPQEHPRIKEAEKKFIEDSFQGKVSNKKVSTPLWSMAKSVPFWSLVILHYGSLWGMYFLLTAAPKFMNEVLGFNLTKSGFLAALPYLARMICAFIFGSIGDAVLKSGRLSVTSIRKIFCIFSHVLPGLLLLSLCFIGDNPYLCVAIITMSLGFNGSSTLTNLQNGQDLAPNFAGSIYSLINFAGTTSGFLSPLVVAHFTKNGNTIDDWSKVFLIGSIVYIVPAIVFVFFGSGEVQPWNDPQKMKADKDTNVESAKPPSVTNPEKPTVTRL